MKTILLLSHSQDFFTIDRVEAALQQQNIKAVRLNTDLFPESIKISEQINKTESSVVVHTEKEHFDTREIGAVWYRKIWQPIIKSPMEEHYLKASSEESIAVRAALFQSMQNLPWLDPIPHVRRASDKFYQLRTASSVGLNIPQTIISNDAEAVKTFFKNLQGGMIGKLHAPLSFGMQSSEFFLYTTQIHKEDLEDMDMLRVCPMIFQELIPKAYELRIAYVDQQCFAGKIQPGNAMDWRIPGLDIFWEPYKINQGLQQQLIALMQKLGLSFGAIDLIARPDGTYVFLEVNPVGEWGMLEKDLDLPISQAIAAGLIKRLS